MNEEATDFTMELDEEAGEDGGVAARMEDEASLIVFSGR
jgi:hypothetical protein